MKNKLNKLLEQMAELQGKRYELGSEKYDKHYDNLKESICIYLNNNHREQRDSLILHGGCHDCASPRVHNIGRCLQCQYCVPNWKLPNLYIESEDVQESEQEEKIYTESEMKEVVDLLTSAFFNRDTLYYSHEARRLIEKYTYCKIVI